MVTFNIFTKRICKIWYAYLWFVQVIHWYLHHILTNAENKGGIWEKSKSFWHLAIIQEHSKAYFLIPIRLDEWYCSIFNLQSPFQGIVCLWIYCLSKSYWVWPPPINRERELAPWEALTSYPPIEDLAELVSQDLLYLHELEGRNRKEMRIQSSKAAKISFATSRIIVNLYHPCIIIWKLDPTE